MICAHSRTKNEVNMARQDRSLVALLYAALVYSTGVYCGDSDDFSDILQRETDKILGLTDFEV